MEVKDALEKFRKQKDSARARGIEWRLTFHEWFTWWGDDLDRRGQGHDQLQMQRVADRGAYELGNIRKGYPRDNAKTNSKMQALKRGQQAIAQEHARLMSLPTKPSEIGVEEGFKRQMTEDEWELYKMFQPRFSRRMICTRS